jgi:flagellar biosynthesis protein FliQ
MTLISPDALLEADVTMIVGVFFLLTLRQALGLTFSPKYIQIAYVPLALFTLSAMILTAGLELPPPALLMALSEGLFLLGLVTALTTIPRAITGKGKFKR